MDIIFSTTQVLVEEENYLFLYFARLKKKINLCKMLVMNHLHLPSVIQIIDPLLEAEDEVVIPLSTAGNSLCSVSQQCWELRATLAQALCQS